ncbi:MAG TPA: hypothetical protein VFW33_08645 [Gemmataceae bacterium]|nr:hypothetical protein [Gemmataceae bacterium]
MPSVKLGMMALAVVALTGAPARAQNWLARPLGAYRSAASWRLPAGGALAGGVVVGTGSFAAGRQTTASFTAAQWQEMVTAQARQTPTLSAAQWQQLVTAQARQPVVPTMSPAQQLNALRAAAVQQQNARLAEALRQLEQQLQQQNAPPPPPHQ